MSLIKCPECGAEVPDKANNCPNCAYTFQENRNNSFVTMAFDKVEGQLFKNGCFVYGPNGRELASCKQGEALTFECKEKMNITVKMSGCFGGHTVAVNPGDKYQVSWRNSGEISVQKVDMITCKY